MPIEITNTNEINIGDIYEDVYFHPCICLGIENGSIWGISLIDGSHPRCVDIEVSGIRKLSYNEAWHWKENGPADRELESKFKWW